MLVTEMGSLPGSPATSANTTRWNIYAPEVAPRCGSPLRAARSCLNASPVAAGLGSYALSSWPASNLCVLDDGSSSFVRSGVDTLPTPSALHDRIVPDE